jgi:rhodanese-related sulfurtransferase
LLISLYGDIQIKRFYFMTIIQPTELQSILQKDSSTQLLDVRTPSEHSQIHVPGVHLIPLDRLDATELANSAMLSKGKPVYILCQSGGRARQAATKLEQSGFEKCFVVEGGTSAWAAAGLPVNRGSSRVISLERQVRIAAGFLVLSGVLLSQLVNPAFIWLSGFIGAGLIFAGSTDWCGMGMLIARMPWNQGASCCSK